MGQMRIALAMLAVLLLLTLQAAQGSCLIQKLPTYLKVSENYDSDTGQLVVYASLTYVDPATGKNEPLVGQPLKFTLNYTDADGEHTEETSISTNAAGKAQATFVIPGSKSHKVKVRYEGTTGFKESEGEVSGGGSDMGSAVQAQLPEGINLVTCMPLLLLVGLLGAAMYASGQNPFGMVDFTAPQGIRTQRRLMKQTVGGWTAVGTSMVASIGNIIMLAGLSGIKARTAEEGKEKEGKKEEGKKKEGESAAKNTTQGQGAAKPPVAAPVHPTKKAEGGKKVEITDKGAAKGVQHDKGMTAVDYESRHAIRAINAGAIIAALGGDFTKIRDFFAIRGSMFGVATVDKEGKKDTIKVIGTSAVLSKVAGVVKKEIDELYTQGKITKEGAKEYSEPTKTISANKERALKINTAANAQKTKIANIVAKTEAEKKNFESEKETKEKERRTLETQLKDKKAQLETAEGTKKAALEKEVKELTSKLGAVERDIKSLNGKIVAADEQIEACAKNMKILEEVCISKSETHLKALLEMEKDSKKAAEQLKSDEYVQASKSFIEYCQVKGYISSNEITVQDAKRIIRELRDGGKGREADELEARLKPVLEPLVTLSNNAYFNERLAATLNGLASEVKTQIRLINERNLSVEDFIKKSIGDLALKKEELDELYKQKPSTPVLETATPEAIIGHSIQTNEYVANAKALLIKGIEDASARGDMQEAVRLSDALHVLDSKAMDAEKGLVAIISGGVDLSSRETIKPHWEKVVAITQTAVGMVADLRYETEKKLNESCEKYGVMPRPEYIQDSKNFAAKHTEANAKITDEEIKGLLPPASFQEPKEVPNPYKAPDRKALLETFSSVAQATSTHIDKVISELIPDEKVKEQMKIDERGAPLSPEERQQYEDTLKYNKQVREELIQKKQELMEISAKIQRGAPNVDELVAESIKLTREIASKYPMRFKNSAEQQKFEESLANAEAAAQKTAEEQVFIEVIKSIMEDYRPGDSVYNKYYRGVEEEGVWKYAGLQRPPSGK